MSEGSSKFAVQGFSVRVCQKGVHQGPVGIRVLAPEHHQLKPPLHRLEKHISKPSAPTQAEAKIASTVRPPASLAS